ncbi:amidophosphoribosyltransferase, partial [Candidatus Peregrinibacteria bacterium RIFOXYC2_FULL_33_13]
MCGIVGIVSNDPAAPQIYDSLIVLQHRGQDAAGILTFDGEKFHMKKAEGLVSDIFTEKDMFRLKGNIGIGHNRYPTAGCGGVDEAQPFMVESPYGISISHNGNIINYDELKKELMEKDKRLLNSKSDSELLLHVFAIALSKFKTDNLNENHIWQAVNEMYSRVQGAYAIVLYIAGQGLLAIRDPYGIKPLVWGERENSLQKEYMFASESVALDALGFKKIRDVQHGEAIFIDNKKNVFSKKLVNKEFRPCIFEYIYFARPDSVIDNVSVYKSRLRLGESLAKKINRDEVDKVIPVPESARSCALGLSIKLKKKYRDGLVKNRYIGRTFIMPGQKLRQASIKRKLNTQPFEIKNLNILVVDDSIVRGNTSKQIVQMVKSAGAKSVQFASSAPPIRYPCFYGIDFPTKKELIAHNNTVKNIATMIDVDRLYYQEIEDTKNSVTVKNKEIIKPCMACFD